MSSVAPSVDVQGSREGWLRAALIRLYPRLWRERYGDELLDLLQSRRLTVGGLLTTVREAFDAHVNLPDLVPGPDGRARLRWSVTTTFAAWVTFFLAAAAVAKSTEAPAFAHATQASAAQGLAWTFASAAFAGAGLAIAYAGLPLAAAAIRQAYRRGDRAAFRLLTFPVAAVSVVAGSGALLGRLQQGPVHSATTVGIAVGWLALAVGAATAVVSSAAALVRRTDVSPRLLRHAGWATVVAAAAMTLGVLSGVGYGLEVWAGSPHLFSSANGVLSTPLPLTWAAALALAIAAVLVADKAACQALRGLRTVG